MKIISKISKLFTTGSKTSKSEDTPPVPFPLNKPFMPTPYLQDGWLPNSGHPLSDIEEKTASWAPYLKLNLESSDQGQSRASWSYGSQAVLVLTTPKEATNGYFIKLTLSALLTKENNHQQQVNVFVGDEKITSWHFKTQQPTPKLLIIPQHLTLGKDTLTISLKTTDAASNSKETTDIPIAERLGVEIYSISVFTDKKNYLNDLQNKYNLVATYRDELIEMEGMELQDRGELIDIVTNVLTTLDNSLAETKPIKEILLSFLNDPYLQGKQTARLSINEEYFSSKFSQLSEGEIDYEIDKWKSGLYAFKEAVLDVGNFTFRHISNDDCESYDLLDTFLKKNSYPADKLKSLKDKNEKLNNLEILLQKDKINSIPPYLEIEMTSFCNFRCVMCSRSMMKFLHAQQNDQQILQISRILPYIKYVTIAGVGEPCSSNKLDILSKVLSKFNCYTTMFTNGSLLHKQLAAASRFARVNVSFDGPNQEIIGAQRRNSKFNAIVENIKSLRRKAPENILAFSVVVSRINLDEIAAIVQLAGELGVNDVNLSPVANVSLLELKKSDQKVYQEQLTLAREIEKEFKVAVNNNVHEDAFSAQNDVPRDKDALIAYFRDLQVPPDNSYNIDDVKKRLESNNFNYYPATIVFPNNHWPSPNNTVESVPDTDTIKAQSFDFDINAELLRLDHSIASLEQEVRARPKDSFKLPYCLAVWKYGYVKSNGKNRLCPHRNVALGNYREIGPKRVLNSEIIQKYRQSMLHPDRVTPMCKECHDHHRIWSIDSLCTTCSELGLDLDSFEKI